MKYLLICLLAGCLVCPAWSQEHRMTLEEFVQKLEEAEPWTYEKVETQLGVKFTMTSSTGVVTWHTALGQFLYGEGLISEHVSLSISASTNETFYLTIHLDDKSNCFAWERIKESYPDGALNFDSMRPGGEMFYIKKRPWGELVFGFRDDKNWNCMTSINIITNSWLK